MKVRKLYCVAKRGHSKATSMCMGEAQKSIFQMSTWWLYLTIQVIFDPCLKSVRNTVSDYCSSDWESDTDSEMEPEEVKKEEIIGKSLLIGIMVYLGLLITAYIFTTVTPLCVCHPDHPDYSTTSYKQLGFYHGSIKLNVGFLIAYAVQPPTPSNIRPCITPVV